MESNELCVKVMILQSNTTVLINSIVNFDTELSRIKSEILTLFHRYFYCLFEWVQILSEVVLNSTPSALKCLLFSAVKFVAERIPDDRMGPADREQQTCIFNPIIYANEFLWIEALR